MVEPTPVATSAVAPAGPVASGPVAAGPPVGPTSPPVPTAPSVPIVRPPPPAPTVYKRPPPTRPPTTDAVSHVVRFQRLEIVSDKESGSGDWRLSLRVNGKAVATRVMQEAGTNGSINLGLEACTNAPEDSGRIAIALEVHELDSREWENVGTSQAVFGYTDWFGEGQNDMIIDAYEGKVRLVYDIVKEPCPKAPATTKDNPRFHCQATCRARYETCGSSKDEADFSCFKACAWGDRDAVVECLGKRPCEDVVDGLPEALLCRQRHGKKPRACAPRSSCAQGGGYRLRSSWYAAAAPKPKKGSGEPAELCRQAPPDGRRGVGEKCRRSDDCPWYQGCACPKNKRACVARTFRARACVHGFCAEAGEACARAIDESQYDGSGGPLCSP